jgi:mediator of RNA polymerase II transcription subunit 12
VTQIWLYCEISLSCNNSLFYFITEECYFTLPQRKLLAVFTTILVARHCFSLQDLVIHVILPSLLAVKTGKMN